VNGVGPLHELLEAHPNAPVAAIDSRGRITPVPPSVPIGEHQAFMGASGLHIIVADDQPAIVEGWSRAQREPHVRVDVHLLADPDRVATVHLVDARAEHGVHVILLEGQDMNAVKRSSKVRAELRRTVARTKKDAVGVFLDVNGATTELLGWTEAELVGRSSSEFVHPDDYEHALDSWLQMRTKTGVSLVRLRLRHKRGHYVWMEVANENRLDDPELACVLSEMTDISEEMAQLEAVKERHQQLAVLAEALPIGLCHVRSDRAVAYANELLVALLGSAPTVDRLLDFVAETDRAGASAKLDGALVGLSGSIEVDVIEDAVERRCELTMRPISNTGGQFDGVILCAADVTDRSRLRSALEHRAAHDALTGCLNRAATVAAVESLLLSGRRVVVSFVDLNRFKAINDAYGHAAGDEVLRVAAARLRGVTREDDIVGRVGGDEFVVISVVSDVVQPVAFAERLTHAVDGDVLFAGNRIRLRVSAGASISAADELDAEAVLQRADSAMYATKRASAEREVRAADVARAR
jgi:diguanylate cyclase (GGDEF)-like protein/PAS domain S-box-containing protein